MPKRKVEKEELSDSDESDSQRTSAKKKTKAPKKGEKVVPLDPSLPVNTTMPLSLTYRAKPHGSTRLATWNVCGLNSASKKGLHKYIDAEDADVLVITETKCQKDPELPALAGYQYRYFGADPALKGQAGVAILTKKKPIDIVYGLPTMENPEKQAARMIQIEYENTFVVGTYTPNASAKLKNMDFKVKWNEAFEKHLRVLDAKKPVIWLGDINCAKTAKDLRNSKTNWNKTPGHTKQESDALESQLNPPADSGHQPLVDVWREKHPDLEGHYTYYSYKRECRTKGIGWRLDTFIVSKRILDKCKECEIRYDAYGASDHLPIYMDYDGEL